MILKTKKEGLKSVSKGGQRGFNFSALLRDNALNKKIGTF